MLVTKLLLVTLVTLVANTLAREIHSDWVRLMQMEDDKRMHPGVTRRTRDIKAKEPNPEENKPAFWNNKAQEILDKHLQLVQQKAVAKNVILFLGDGMSIPTLTASRIYKGQMSSVGGEESVLAWESFPYTGLSKTYCVDTQVADSACTATAYLTGVKNNEGTIGVTASVKKGDCEAMNVQENHVQSILSWSQGKNKRTGIVTTTRVTHASPAGTYAHTAHRDWEADSHVIKDGLDPKKCRDIAYQLINEEPGKNINVILGGGRSEFRSSSVLDEEGQRGYRLDRTDLIKEWNNHHPNKSQYVWEREGLLAVDSNTDFLLGLFEGDHTRYNLDRDAKADPTLAEMTEAAIKVLQDKDDGYFLFVEGGRIDHAHHDTLAHKALDETAQLSLAVEKAVEMNKDRTDTLIVVTSDHAHTMSMAGYPERNSDILGIPEMSPMDKKPYATLSYSNGPGYRVEEDGSRHDMSADDMSDKNYKYPAMVPLSSETHGGDDVAVFAMGPYSFLFSGNYEQNAIPHIMAFASCVAQGEQSNAEEC